MSPSSLLNHTEKSVSGVLIENCLCMFILTQWKKLIDMYNYYMYIQIPNDCKAMH